MLQVEHFGDPAVYSEERGIVQACMQASFLESAVHVDPPVQMDTSCKGIGDFQSESMDIWCAKNCGKGERYCEATRCKCGGTPSDAVLEFVKALISRGKGAGAHITVSRSGKPKL